MRWHIFAVSLWLVGVRAVTIPVYVWLYVCVLQECGRWAHSLLSLLTRKHSQNERRGQTESDKRESKKGEKGRKKVRRL